MKKKLIIAMLCSSVCILESVSRPALRITGRRFKDRQSLNSFLEKLNQLFGLKPHASTVLPASPVVESVNAPISQDVIQPVDVVVSNVNNPIDLVAGDSSLVNEDNQVVAQGIESAVELINAVVPVNNEPEVIDIPVEVVNILFASQTSDQQATQLDQSEIVSDVLQIPVENDLTDIKRNEKCGCHHNNKPRADNAATVSNYMVCDKCGCHYQKPKDK